MILAENTIANVIQVTYNRDIQAIDWDPSMFSTFPAGDIPDTVDLASDESIELTFLHLSVGNTKLTFEGLLPNVLSPQEIPL